MSGLGNGLSEARLHEDALPVKETELSMERRLGASEHTLLVMQGNIANTYSALDRDEEALSMRHEVYSGHLNLDGEETEDTLLQPSTTGTLFSIYGASKKPRHCCAERCPWRGALSERVMKPRSG